MAIGITALIIFLGRNRYSTRLPYYPSEYNVSGGYKINPYTIIESLDNGDKSTFVPMSATPEPGDILIATGSISWIQSDYLKIERALFEFLWKESLDDWKIHSIAFDKDCENTQIGFDRADISLYKVNNKEYILRTIAIYPLANEVNWGGETTFPRPFLGEWKNIDLNNFKVTADDALRIAEEYGGKKIRLDNNNDCRIFVGIPGSKGSEKWEVSYYYTSFDLLVDPFSGKYEILK